jgi:hypothetical protein
VWSVLVSGPNQFLDFRGIDSVRMAVGAALLDQSGDAAELGIAAVLSHNCHQFVHAYATSQHACAVHVWSPRWLLTCVLVQHQCMTVCIPACLSLLVSAAVFAYPGGASMEIHQALTRSETVDNILCRHEQVRNSRRVGPQGIASQECSLQTQQAGSAVQPAQSRAVVPSMRGEV